MNLKLGKKLARYDHRDLLMSRYLDYSKLPPLPDQFGEESRIVNWGMLGNDNAGNCVWAGSAHETMLWTAIGSTPAKFDDASVNSDYSAVTDYNPADPATDQGTDMHDAIKYRQQVGIIDADGKRHKIGAYVWLEPGNLKMLLYSMFLFKAVGIGVRFPNSAMDQFNSGAPWSVVGGATVSGGHYVSGVCQREDPACVSWARVQPFTNGFYQTYNDESVVMFSEEALKCGRTPEGFRAQELMKDLEVLGSPVVTKKSRKFVSLISKVES